MATSAPPPFWLLSPSTTRAWHSHYRGSGNAARMAKAAATGADSGGGTWQHEASDGPGMLDCAPGSGVGGEEVGDG